MASDAARRDGHERQEPDLRRTGRGPLDGLLLGSTDFTQDVINTGVALATEPGQFGAGARAVYDPRPGDAGHFDWTGKTP